MLSLHVESNDWSPFQYVCSQIFLPTQQSDLLIVICILQDWFDKFEFLQFEVYTHYLYLIHYVHISD